ncbi:MAG: tetratricopeptide repeat protein [bacterium]
MSPTDGTGVAIGHYLLREKIGEGGFGEVYAADQTEPVKRRVALKVIKAGMDTKSVLARFEAERQALALMDHPGIAKVLDAGETERGRPYFVMELVRGEPITAYCDRHTMSIRERLELFIEVCHAVQHAHQKGIIHRDLKPSNVLVSIVGKRALPKVIDFGIAKATSLALTERTLFTEQGVLIGTPEYMSPEQAEMGGLDVDTRTDIYSLGIVLYELLTGAVPFDSKSLRRSGYAHIREIIRDTEPAKPSTKVSSRGGDATEAARRRRTEVHRLTRELRGELDWIVLKALEKDRTRRYETADALALDVGRFLNDQPVLAGPPSTLYHMSKFVKRHRTGIVLGAVVAAALVFATVESYRQRTIAEKARSESEAVTQFIAGMLAAADPTQRGRDVTVGDLLDEASLRVGREFAQAPLVRARLAATMARAYFELGRFEKARALATESLVLRESSLGKDDLLVAESLNLVGTIEGELAEFPAARANLERALALREKSLGPEALPVAESLIELGSLLQTIGDRDGARAHFERAVAIRERALGPDHADLAKSLTSLAVFHFQNREFTRARALFERAIAIQERLLGPDHLHLVTTLGNYAFTVVALGDTAAAWALQDRVRAIREKSLGADHPDVAKSLISQAMLRAASARYDDASALYEKALAIEEKAFGPDHPDVAICLNNYAACLMDAGQHEKARPIYERALAIREKAFGPVHFDVAQSLNVLAYHFTVVGEYARAVPLLERAMSIEATVLGPEDIHVADTAERLAQVLNLMGEAARAAEFETRAREIKARLAAAE